MADLAQLKKILSSTTNLMKSGIEMFALAGIQAASNFLDGLLGEKNIDEELSKYDLPPLPILYSNIGRGFKICGKLEEALEANRKSEQIIRERGNSADLAFVLSNIGSIYDDLNQNKKAIDTYSEALALCDNTEEKQGKAAILNNLAVVYNKIGQNSKAISKFKEALNIAVAREDFGLAKQIQVTLEKFETKDGKFSLYAEWPFSGKFSKKFIQYSGDGGKTWVPLDMDGSDKKFFYIVILGGGSLSRVQYYYEGIRPSGEKEIDDNDGNFYQLNADPVED